MNVVLSEANLITRSSELRTLAKQLADQPTLAVDTESNSLYAYQEKVCLIQFSTPQTDYLIDPLAIHDLSPLGPIFENPQILKVFHAAEYDLICLHRDFCFQFANLFDTMVATRILGRTTLGLGAILEAEFGMSVDKRQQRANWGQRPLPQHLLDYARMDTHYLIALQEKLRDDLQRTDRWELAEEDFKRLCKINGKTQEEDLNTNHSISGGRELPAQQYTVLLQLWDYRDQMARQMNRPLFKVMGDKTLLAIAEACPKNSEQLKKLPGMTDGQVSRHGRAILSAVQRGLEATPVYPPHSQRPDERFIVRLEKLRNWRKVSAKSLGVESDVVLPKDLLCELAKQNPQTKEDLRLVLQDVPWRLERFGGQILKLLR